ncbi:MAG: T9SS type A sorting domain-containing protein [Bacteroidota bacterium]
MNSISKMTIGASFLLLLFLPELSHAQQRAFSQAKGVTVFWNNSSAAPQMQQQADAPQALSSGRVYVPKEGQTVFTYPAISDTRDREVMPAPTFEFTGTPIRWYLLNQDSTYRDVELKYMTKNYDLLQRDWLVHSDGSIYQLFQSGQNEGSVLQRIDSRTGELNWINIHNLTTQDQIETGLSLFERANGNVEVTGYHLFSNEVPNLLPAGLGLSKVYNHNSGKLESQSFTQYEQGGLTSRNSAGRFGRILPIAEGETYLVIDQMITKDKQYTYLVRSMDAQGKEIDVLNRIPRGQATAASNYIQCDAKKINDRLYVFGASQYATAPDTAAVLNELIWLNEQGQVVNRKDYTKLLNYAGYFHIDLYDDRIFLTAITAFNPVDGDLRPQASLLVLDLEGKVLKQYSRFQVDGRYATAMQAIPLDEPDTYLYVAHFRGEEQLVYLREEADGQIREVGALQPIADDLELTPFGLARNPDGDVLTYLKIQAKIPAVDPILNRPTDEKVGNWLFTYAIDGRNLGLQTSTLEPLAIQEAKIFPNPGTGIYQISWTAPFSGQLELTDMMGRTLRAAALQDSEITTLDITDLESGIYLLNLVGENAQQKKTYKVVKL